MTIGIAHLQPIVSLIAGVLILIMPGCSTTSCDLFDYFGVIGLGLVR